MGGTVTATQLMADLTRLGIKLEAHGDRLRYSPRSAVTPDLADRMKAHKGELLAILTADPVTLETRQQVYAQMVERVNAANQGGPIDWPQLDAIEQRIWTAETLAALMRAAEVYECVALCRNDTGQLGQHCV